MRTPIHLVLTRAGAVTAVGATLVGLVGPAAYSQPATFFGALGLLLLALSLMLGYDPEALHSVVGRDAGRARQLRIVGLGSLLGVAMFFSLTILVFSFLGKYTDIAESPGAAVARLALLLALALAILVGMLHDRALLSTQPRFLPRRLRVLAGLLALGAASFALALVLGGVGPLPRLPRGDAELVLLGGFTFLALTLLVLREIPSPYSVLSSPRFRLATTRAPAYFAPTFGILAAICAILPFFVLRYRDIPPILGIPGRIAILGVAALVAILFLFIAVAYLVQASRARPDVFHTRGWRELRVAPLVLGASAFFAIILLALATLLFFGVPILDIKQERWIDAFTACLAVALGPYGYYLSWNDRRARKIEENFPEFLRDLASGRKTGLTLPKSLEVASRGSYGPLDPEIWKMRGQLDWGVSFEEVIDQFSDRVKTPRIGRATAIVTRATRLGGNVSEVLLVTAENTREMKNLENDRRVSMTLYVLVIYVAFLVFLGVALVLYGSLIPAFSEAAAAVAAVPGQSTLIVAAPSITDYRTFYYLASVVQAVGNGLVAGLIGTGRVSGGLLHAALLLLATFFAFVWFP